MKDSDRRTHIGTVPPLVRVRQRLAVDRHLISGQALIFGQNRVDDPLERGLNDDAALATWTYIVRAGLVGSKELK
jgi:hypothetical protein